MPSTNGRNSAVAALLLNAAVWGLSWWPFQFLQTHGLHPLWATAWVYGACFSVIALWHAASGSPLWHGHTGLWWLLVCAGLTNVGFNWAVATGDVVRVVLLFYLMPAWSVLLAWWVLGERPTRAHLLRVALALTGVLIVLKRPDTPWPIPNSLSDVLALGGGACFAMTNVLLRQLRDVPQAPRMLSMFAGGGLMACAVALLAGIPAWTPTQAAPAAMWVLGALALAFLASNAALQFGAARLSAQVTALIMLSEVVFASASAVWLGAAQWDNQTSVGGALIVWAALMAIGPKKSP